MKLASPAILEQPVQLVNEALLVNEAIRVIRESLAQ